MNDLIYALKDCMAEELLLLTSFSENEKQLKNHIQNHDWTNLEKIIKMMSPISEQIDNLDKKRADVFKSLCAIYGESEQAGFYQVAVHFAADLRNQCSELYQQLKIAVIRIQSITWIIDNYVRTVTGTIHQVIDNIYPHRKGNLYCSKGNVKKNANADPMLINQQL